MFRTLIVVGVFALSPTSAAARTATAAHHTQHRPTTRCRTLRCDRAWGRRHRWHPPQPWHTSKTSWYADGGSTACGSHYPLGFAHLGPGEGPYPGMPCGARVRFCAVRCAVGTMDDHGPYIFSREFDLNEALRAAIGAETDAPVRWQRIG